MFRSLRRRPAVAAAVTAAAAALTVAATLLPAGQSHAADTSVTVDFAVSGGAPEHLASGTLYGLSPDGTQPPDEFYTEIGWNYERAGGAQLNGGGYASSVEEYETRWDSTLAQYQRTEALGGTFVLLPHDLWGADGTTDQPFPGDNGDWSTFDAFVDRLISDVQANDMTVQWDLWNEPDYETFWPRSQEQYLEMWTRFYTAVREAFPDQLIVGPSTARSPSADDDWWNPFLAHVSEGGVAPDIYSWHNLPGDPDASKNEMNGLLDAYGLSTDQRYQINEYGAPDQQNPGFGAWYIARLERASVYGLRANWAMGGDLHDDQAGLLTREGDSYAPLGEWHAYRYYGSQSGNIVNVVPGTNVDAFATKDNDAGNAQILLGSAGNTGTVTVNLTGLDTTAVAGDGTVRAVLERIPYDEGAAVEGPVPVSDEVLTVTDSGASVAVPWTDARDAYTLTLLPSGS
jgi:hypothetical protein